MSSSQLTERTGNSSQDFTGGSPNRPEVVARVADFTELNPPGGTLGSESLDRLLDVTVTATAGLGRVNLSIGDILKLGIGSVLELNRSISEPVDLIVQGSRLARGEVVVVNDRFALRIKEITDPKRRS